MGTSEKRHRARANPGWLWYPKDMETAHTLRSENLDWDKRSMSFHVDASTLYLLPGLPMPRTLEVVSHRTGRTARYELHDREMAGGDVVRWNYRPADGDTAAQTTRGVSIWNT
jgi:hypothetical protein